MVGWASARECHLAAQLAEASNRGAEHWGFPAAPADQNVGHADQLQHCEGSSGTVREHNAGISSARIDGDQTSGLTRQHCRRTRIGTDVDDAETANDRSRLVFP